MVKRLLNAAKPYLVFMLPALVIGGVVGTYPGYKAFQYTWVDSGFCTKCHIHDYANVSWKKSIHGKITTCHDCHHQPLVQYFEEAVALVTKKPRFPLDMKHVPHVEKHLCEGCHWDFGHSGHADVAGPLSSHALKDIPKVSNTRLHKLHLSKEVKLPFPQQQHLGAALKGKWIEDSMLGHGADADKTVWQARPIMCIDCHGGIANRAHNFGATDVACVRCHNALPAKFAHTQVQTTFGCRNCHFLEFMVETGP
ncbi:hypothetical protein WDW37_12890 [Bdellovibrionota bacterium FG-1]